MDFTPLKAAYDRDGYVIARQLLVPHEFAELNRNLNRFSPGRKLFSRQAAIPLPFRRQILRFPDNPEVGAMAGSASRHSSPS